LPLRGDDSANAGGLHPGIPCPVTGQAFEQPLKEAFSAGRQCRPPISRIKKQAHAAARVCFIFIHPENVRARKGYSMMIIT
jgi:hypothetical protein